MALLVGKALGLCCLAPALGFSALADAAANLLQKSLFVEVHD
jgi:hypothetical protein